MAFLTGPSGAGKSTLLKLIAAIERPTRGQVFINRKNITRIPKRKVPALRRHMGVVFQDHHLLHDRNVFDNVSLPLQISGFAQVDINRRVRAALDKVALLDKEQMMPITLSGGEQQRVGIARAVVHKPAILLADEPTGNLDRKSGKNIVDLMVKLCKEEGITFCVVTHDPTLSSVADRLLVMEDGKLFETKEKYAEFGIVR